MTHSEQALQWLSEGKTVLLGKNLNVTREDFPGSTSIYIDGTWVSHVLFNALVDAGLPLTYKEPEQQVWVYDMLTSPRSEFTSFGVRMKGNVTEAQVKAALKSIGEKP